MAGRDLYFSVTAKIAPYRNEYIAFCDELGLATSGDSFEDASKRLDTAVDLVVNTAIETGQIIPLLEKRDIPLHIAPPKEMALGGPCAWESSRLQKISRVLV